MTGARLLARFAAWWRHAPLERVPLEGLLDVGFVAIDLETTGLDPRRDAVVSAAAIPFIGGEPRPGYVTLVHPGRAIPATSTAIHGITDAAVVGAPALDAVLPALVGVCAGHVLVGHDVGFDLAVLAEARRVRGLPPAPAVALDTRRLAVALYPDWRARSGLEDVAARLGIAVVGRHTADGDARLAGMILVALLGAFRERGARSVADLVWAQTAVFRRA